MTDIVDDIGELLAIILLMFVGFVSLARYVTIANTNAYDDTGYDKIKKVNSATLSNLKTMDDLEVNGVDAAYIFYNMSNIYNEKVTSLGYIEADGWDGDSDDTHILTARKGEWAVYHITQFYQPHVVNKLRTKESATTYTTYKLKLVPSTYVKENNIWTLIPQ